MQNIRHTQQMPEFGLAPHNPILFFFLTFWCPDLEPLREMALCTGVVIFKNHSRKWLRSRSRRGGGGGGVYSLCPEATPTEKPRGPAKSPSGTRKQNTGVSHAPRHGIVSLSGHKKNPETTPAPPLTREYTGQSLKQITLF